MEHASAVGVIERFGQPSPEPADGLDEIGLSQHFPVAQAGRMQRGRRVREGVDGFEDGPPVPVALAFLGQGRDEPVEGCARHILHVQQPQVVARVHDLSEDMNNVVVLETGERARLGALVGGHLEESIRPSSSYLRYEWFP